VLLDAKQRAFFAENGWLVVRGAVSRQHAGELESAVDEIHAASPPAGAGQVWEMSGASRISWRIAEHARDAAIAQRVAETLGCSSVKLLQDSVLVKAARVGGAVAWHQDHSYTAYLDPPRVVSVRLALSDCKLVNGCLEVISGSHTWGLLGEPRAFTDTHIANALGQDEERHRERAVAIELCPGDISMHHCLTLHRSGKNRSEAPRKTLVTRLFDFDCRLVPERLPGDAVMHFPVDEDGRLAASAFPVVYAAARGR